MTIADELLKIKTYREDKAERAVLAQARVLAEATQERDGAERRLREYRDYAAEQERRMYAGLFARAVHMRDIEHVHGQVRSLNQREREHDAELQEAEARRVDEVQQLEIAQDAHALARRKRDKFAELADEFRHEARAEIERRDDAEIEEVAGTSRTERLA